MISVRRSTYRGKEGFSVVGEGKRIFTESREDAEQIRQNIRAGYDATEHWGEAQERTRRLHNEFIARLEQRHTDQGHSGTSGFIMCPVCRAEVSA